MYAGPYRAVQKANLHVSYLGAPMNSFTVTLSPVQFYYARQHAIARMCHANSVCPSVCPSVCHTRALGQNG